MTERRIGWLEYRKRQKLEALRGLPPGYCREKRIALEEKLGAKELGISKRAFRERKERLQNEGIAARFTQGFIKENGEELRANPESIFAIRDLIELKRREEIAENKDADPVDIQLLALQRHEINRNRIRNDSYRDASDKFMDLYLRFFRNEVWPVGRSAMIKNLESVESALTRTQEERREV